MHHSLRCHPERRIALFAIRSRRTPTAKPAAATGLDIATPSQPIAISLDYDLSRLRRSRPTRRTADRVVNFTQSRENRLGVSNQTDRPRFEIHCFDCAGKERDANMLTHAAVVPFPSTGGVDVSLHTLGPAAKTLSSPMLFACRQNSSPAILATSETRKANSTPAGHRRRSHRAIRPRRSETMNCHYMMREGRGKQQPGGKGSEGSRSWMVNRGSYLSAWCRGSSWVGR